MKNDKIYLLNAETGKADIINQWDITKNDWGFSFHCDSMELAYMAAYSYRHSPHGCRVEYARPMHYWMVTIFNDKAAAMGIDGAK